MSTEGPAGHRDLAAPDPWHWGGERPVETELFVHFAEIAGVFVGFGALISLRSAPLTDAHDVMYLRAVLCLGVWVVVCALVPIAVSRYGVNGHALWLPCAVAAMCLWGVLLAILTRASASREINRSPERVDRLFPLVGLPLHVVTAGSLALVLVGAWPRSEAALYVTALTAGVVFAGYTLLTLVMSQQPSPSA